jgi:hypothetical protein
VLKSPALQSSTYPLEISVDEYRDKTDCDQPVYDEVVEAIYCYQYELTPETFEDVEVEWEVLFNYEGDILDPGTSFDCSTTWNSYRSKHEQRILTSDSVMHQAIDEIMFPDLLLHECPSSFSSSQMYEITRNYIKENIDTSVAEIVSDHDFCFKVNKKVKKNTPEVLTYYDLFARTKKARNKPQTKTIHYDRYIVFEMTHEPENYKDYTPIPAMYADTEAELVEKVNAWLKYVIGVINEPLCQCPHCKGRGYLVPDKITFEDKLEVDNNLNTK